MKFKFEPSDSFPPATILIYDEAYRLPLRIALVVDRQAGYYGRNQAEKDFIEFKFLTEDKRLSKIAVILLNRSAVVRVSQINLGDCDHLPYSCHLVDEDAKPQMSLPVTYRRSSDMVQLSWLPEADIACNYLIAEQCAIGVTRDNSFGSITVLDLDEESIDAIFR